MSRGLIISAGVLIGVGGLIFALMQSVQSSGDRALDRVAETLEQCERQIGSCEGLVEQLEGRFAAKAQLKLIGNMNALREQLAGLRERRTALVGDTKQVEPRRRLGEDAQQLLEHIGEHRGYLDQLTTAVREISEARAPVQDLIRRIRGELEARKASLTPSDFARLRTRLDSLQTRFDRFQFLASDGLKVLYSDPDEKSGQTETRAAAQGFRDLKPALQELLAETEQG